MKKVYLAALLALPMFAVAAQADGCWFPQRIDARVDFHFKVQGPGDYQVGQLGPWYLYWPMEAHFQTPSTIQTRVAPVKAFVTALPDALAADRS